MRGPDHTDRYTSLINENEATAVGIQRVILTALLRSTLVGKGNQCRESTTSCRIHCSRLLIDREREGERVSSYEIPSSTRFQILLSANRGISALPALFLTSSLLRMGRRIEKQNNLGASNPDLEYAPRCFLQESKSGKANRQSHPCWNCGCSMPSRSQQSQL